MSSQLDVRHAGSRHIVRDLHRARKCGTSLHMFLAREKAQYYLTARGRENVLQRLKRTESVFSLVMSLTGLGGHTRQSSYVTRNT